VFSIQEAGSNPTRVSTPFIHAVFLNLELRYFARSGERRFRAGAATVIRLPTGRMSHPPNPTLAARENVITRLSEAASSCLKQLLETKHLYQKVSVPADSIIKQVREGTGDAKLLFDEAMEPILKRPHFALSSEIMRLADRDGSESTLLTLVVSNVKIFCAECQSREAFRPIWYRDLANELAGIARRDGPDPSSLPPDFQLFFLAFQCQVCGGAPEAFIVRRRGWNLFHEGRSPIEFVEIPSYLPKEEREFFRDAIIARNTGRTLAGLFYLRTFIEQFARRRTGSMGRLAGDQIFDEYNKTIPERQREHIPSLRDWYDKLSEALHEARTDDALFEEAKSEIERHFDFRRIFKIT